MNEYGQHGVRTYQDRFGSWNSAIEEAGLTPNTPEDNRTPEAELLDDLRRVAEETGRTPTMVDIEEYGEYHPSTYQKRFSGIKEARELAGLSSENQAGKWSSNSRDLREKVRNSPTAEIDVDDTVPFDGGEVWD